MAPKVIGFTIRPKTAPVLLMLALIQERGYTVVEMVEATGFSRDTASDWLYSMHQMEKNLVYISEWVRGGKNLVPRYSWGFMRLDVPKPDTNRMQKRRKAQAEYRARKKALQSIAQPKVEPALID